VKYQSASPLGEDNSILPSSDYAQCNELTSVTLKTKTCGLQGGTFEVRECAEYTGRNPKTGEETAVLSKKPPFFKVSKVFKERVNQK